MMTVKPKPRLYSYIRFSTPEQSLGDSERRQIDGAARFAAERGMKLDETLKLTDRGLSGYHGAHRKKGALGKFLAVAEEGHIPPGSILLVENVDRLGREGAGNLLKHICFKLWERDISIATLTPEEVYPPGCDGDPKFLVLMLFAQRAYDESQRKSERIRAARIQAREKARSEGRLLTSRIPAWLDEEHARKTGERVPIPEAVETINRIFQLRVEGLSAQRIARLLNEGSTWTRKNGWRNS